MNEPSPRSSTLSSPWTFFAVTFLWTWALCGVLIVFDLSDRPALSGALLLGAMIGPGVAGIYFTQRTRTREQRRDFWRRVIDVRRLTWPWVVAVVAIPFGLQIASGAFDGLLGGAGPSWGEAAGAFLADPATQILSLWIISLVPFFEEMGWRGYAQDRLMERHGAVGASVILGVVWSVWHLPAFFVPGTYHASMGFFTLEALLFFVGVVALSMVVSWIYINTRRSILIMVVLHAMVNLSGELIALTERGEVFFTVAWIVAAVAIVLTCGPSMHAGRIRWSRRVPAATALLVVAVGVAVVAPRAVANPMIDDEMTRTLGEVRAEYDLPGITAAVVLPDGSVHTAASGFADVERGIAMRPDTPMLAASVGKTFVAATAVSLADEGVVDLDGPVARWLADRPWFERLPNHATITLRHLLDHTSGVVDHVHDEAFREIFAREWGDPSADVSAERWIGLVLDREPLFAPGEGFAYSDTGYLLAGLVIEAGAGRSLDELVLERFVAPLGLTSTRPSDRRDLPGLACGHVAADDPFGLPRRTLDARGMMVWDPAIEGAAGGLASTARDLAVWAHWAFTEGPTRPAVTAPEPSVGAASGYALGVAFHEGGAFGPTCGHAGWIPGTVTSMRFHRDHGVAVAFQVNTDVGAEVFVPELEQRLAGLAVEAVHRAGR